MSRLYNRIAFTTATTGTGVLTVGSALINCRTPATAAIPDGTVVSYSIKDGTAYEDGYGTIGGSGTTLNRAPVDSSNSNNLISLSGAAEVRFTLLSHDVPTAPFSYRPPGPTDDSSLQFAVGNLWLDRTTAEHYRAEDVTVGKATWSRVIGGNVLPVDYVGQATAAYGTRLLSSAYSGPCLRVRRASDSMEIDIYFQSGSIDTVSLDNFLRGTIGYVRTLYDQSGNARHAVQTTTANQPVIGLGRPGEARYLSCNGHESATSTAQYLIIPTTVSLDRANSSIVGVGAFQSSQNSGVSGTISGSVMFQFGSDVINFYTVGDGNFAAWAALTNSGHVFCDPFVFGLHGGTGTNGMILQVANEQSLATSTASVVSGGYLGYTTIGTGYSFQGDIGALIVFPTKLSTTQQPIVRASLEKLFNVAAQHHELVVADGDSITSGSLVGNTSNYLNQAAARFSRPKRLRNTAIFGTTVGPSATAGTMLNRFSAAPGPGGIPLTYYITPIASLLGGSNDLVAGARTAAAIYTDISTWISTAKGLGYKTIVCTVLPRTDCVGATETARTTLNTSIRGNAGGADFICDFAADPIMGSGAANTALYSDGIHPTEYGHGLLANLYAYAVNALSYATSIATPRSESLIPTGLSLSQGDDRWAGSPPATIRPPTNADDTTRGFVGSGPVSTTESHWLNIASAIVYKCVSHTANSAVWAQFFSTDTLPLDIVSVGTTGSAYGVRLLRKAYTGYCLRVRRASDSGVQDIGFVNGTIDISALDAFLMNETDRTGFVTIWYDQSGNGLDATQVTAANQPKIGGPIAAGMRMISFIGQLNVTPPGLYFNVPAGVSLARANTSIMGVSSFHLSAYQSSLFETGAGAAYGIGIFGQVVVTSQNVTINACGNTITTTYRPTSDPLVWGLHCSGSGTALSYGNNTASNATVQTVGTVTGGFIGHTTTSTGATIDTNYEFEGEHGALIYYSTGVLTTAQQQLIRASLTRVFAAPPQNPDDILVIDGDSVPSGGPGSTLGFGSQVKAYLHRPRRLYQQPIWGALLSNLVGITAAKLGQLPGSLFSNRIVVLSAGTNDVVGAQSAATIYGNMTTYTATAHGAGYYVVLCTVLPRSDITAGALETVRTTLNALIVANAAGADAIADLAADPTMGNGSTSYNDTTLYNADHVHPTIYGHSILASIVAKAVNGLSLANVQQWRSDAMLLPTIGGTTANTLKTVQTFTAGATWTKPSGCRFIKVRLAGGGGSGGGVSGTASNGAMSSGGGSGAYSEAVYEVTNIATATVTVGAGGTAPTAGANAGNAGNQSSFAATGLTTVTAPGGGGGVLMATGTAITINQGGAAGAAGTGPSGAFLVAGAPGGFSQRQSATVGIAGNGAPSAFGGGGLGPTAAAGGNVGTAYGSGGSGANTQGATNRSGGAGAAGVVIVEEYY